jgi:hypothetical protein
MRLSRVLFAGTAVAAAAVATSAFTNSNTFHAGGAADDNVGYGELAVSGVTVSNVAYTPVSTDATVLDTVVFTVTEDAGDMVPYLTLTDASDAKLGSSPFTCVPSGTGPYLVTCDVDSVVIKDITKVGLTVVSK